MHIVGEAPRNHNSRRRFGVGLSVAALVGGVIGYTIHGSSNEGRPSAKASAPLTAKPHPTQRSKETKQSEQAKLAQAQKQARADLTASAIKTSMSVLNDLDKPTAGTIYYNPSKSGDFITNKASLLESNSSTINPNYKYVPEIRAAYYPSLRLATILAASETKVPSGSNAGEDEFTIVDMGFTVSPNSQLAKVAETRKLTTVDFGQAITSPSTALNMIDVSYNWGSKNNGSQFGVNGNGVVFFDGSVYTSNKGMVSTDDYLIEGGIKSSIQLMDKASDPNRLEPEVSAIDELLPKAAGQLAIFSDDMLPPVSSLLDQQ